VVGLLEEPCLRQAALAVPGFVTAVVTHAFKPSDMTQYNSRSYARAAAPLLGALVSQEAGRAALLAQPEALGQAARCAAASDEFSLKYCLHLAQLWAAGQGQGLAGAMVAGLAAGVVGWMQFFGWVVKKRPAEEWCQLPGLLPALTAAFVADQGRGMPPQLRNLGVSPLHDVLAWLLEREQGQQLLSSSQELARVVGRWLVHKASVYHPSPLAGLLRKPTPVAAAGMSRLAASPVLFKTALVSLVNCSGDYGHFQSVEAWVKQNKQLQQLVLGDRGLLRLLLRALATWCSNISCRGHAGGPNTPAMCVLLQLPVKELLPQLFEVLAGEEQGRGSRPPAAAAASKPDALMAHGACLAIQQIQESSTAGGQLVVEAMQQLAKNAGRVGQLQQVEAAGHATWVAAAQARQELVAQHAAAQQQLQQKREEMKLERQQMQKEKEAIELKQQQLQQEREALQLEKQQLQLEREAFELKQQQLQQEREALQAERQQLGQLGGGADKKRKREQVR
jgi:hypothetical protein